MFDVAVITRLESERQETRSACAQLFGFVRHATPVRLPRE
jgi:hypothetical protein